MCETLIFLFAVVGLFTQLLCLVSTRSGLPMQNMLHAEEVPTWACSHTGVSKYRSVGRLSEKAAAHWHWWGPSSELMSLRQTQGVAQGVSVPLLSESNVFFYFWTVYQVHVWTTKIGPAK